MGFRIWGLVPGALNSMSGGLKCKAWSWYSLSLIYGLWLEASHVRFVQGLGLEVCCMVFWVWFEDVGP